MDDAKPKDPKKPSGPIRIGKYTVHIDRDLCIGAATCAAIAPKTFNLDSEAKAIILETAGQDGDQTVLEAAQACPTAAIIIVDEHGNKVYPK